MLEKFILEKSELISYSQTELSNIAATSNHLRGIIKNQRDFNESFLGGSYKRGTMVKGISDVDVYFQYTGISDPGTALTRLKTCLVNTFPRTTIKKDRPSIHIDFDRIPFNITPFKKDIWSQNLSIPDNMLYGWQPIRFGELEAAIVALRAKNSKYVHMIKILKLWNRNYKRGLRNFEIELKVSNMFLYPMYSNSTLPDWILTFFRNQGFYNDANRFSSLMLNRGYGESMLKTEWLKFIDNK